MLLCFIACTVTLILNKEKNKAKAHSYHFITFFSLKNKTKQNKDNPPRQLVGKYQGPLFPGFSMLTAMLQPFLKGLWDTTFSQCTWNWPASLGLQNNGFLLQMHLLSCNDLFTYLFSYYWLLSPRYRLTPFRLQQASSSKHQSTWWKESAAHGLILPSSEQSPSGDWLLAAISSYMDFTCILNTGAQHRCFLKTHFVAELSSALSAYKPLLFHLSGNKELLQYWSKQRSRGPSQPLWFCDNRTLILSIFLI